LFITHDLQVAKHVSDKWIYLDKGRVSELPKEWMNI
jgi:ABC-type oligopeptide transport system ATPase subunit